jgi:hypothetical protein
MKKKGTASVRMLTSPPRLRAGSYLFTKKYSDAKEPFHRKASL